MEPKEACSTQELLYKIRNQSSNLFARSQYKFYDCTTSADLSKKLLSNVPETSCTLGQHLVPNTPYMYETIDDTRIYNGQFSPEGSLYYTSSQESIKLYNTLDPYEWKQLAEIPAREIYWTITDTDLFEGPSGPSMLYSSINPVVYLVNPLKDSQTPLNFSTSPLLSEEIDENGFYFGIWSVKFSGDGTEVIAGCTNGGLCIYNIEKSRVLNFAKSHKDDVNTVCWDNKKTSHILYTGSDDCTILVWDRRILGEKQRPAGALIGHQEGITHVCSQGDSLHLISNAKDQLLKYWDIRKMHKIPELRSMPPIRKTRGFDYRYMRYPLKGKQARHPYDCSVGEYSGHTVLATLIRCYFSPLETTNQRYIYTGSAAGAVHIFDLVTGKEVQRLSLLGGDYEESKEESIMPIRDVSWHPKYPLMIATTFSGNIYGWQYKAGRINI